MNIILNGVVTGCAVATDDESGEQTSTINAEISEPPVHFEGKLIMPPSVNVKLPWPSDFIWKAVGKTFRITFEEIDPNQPQ